MKVIDRVLTLGEVSASDLPFPLVHTLRLIICSRDISSSECEASKRFRVGLSMVFLCT